MSAEENKNECDDKKKEEKKDPPLQTNLKTTTETSAECCRSSLPSYVSKDGKTHSHCSESSEPEFGWSFRTFFFLSRFGSKDEVHEEKLPKNFKDLDHLFNKILSNLEETENVFLNQAKAVMDRDLTLINWRFRLKALQNTLKEKKEDFERIDQTVQCIFRLNSYIDDILCKLEKELPGPSLIENAFKYSPVRMTMYDTMMKININQRDMMQQLSNAVLSINEAIECNPLDPVEQFTRILSLHTEILRTIEMRTGLIEEQLAMVKTLQKYYTNTKKPLGCDCYCWFNV